MTRICYGVILILVVARLKNLICILTSLPHPLTFPLLTEKCCIQYETGSELYKNRLLEFNSLKDPQDYFTNRKMKLEFIFSFGEWKISSRSYQFFFSWSNKIYLFLAMLWAPNFFLSFFFFSLSNLYIYIFLFTKNVWYHMMSFYFFLSQYCFTTDFH